MLDPKVISGFRSDGHAVIRRIVPREDVASFRPVIERVVVDVSSRADQQGRIDDYSRLFTQVTNIWRADEEARRIVLDKRFAAVAAGLLGVPSVRLYHDQALFKPSGAARTPWHRDRHYWPLDTELTVTMWLPLIDVTTEMGLMIFASGSHRAAGLGDLAISEETDRRLEEVIARNEWPLWSEPIAAGDATFHLGATIHSAGANEAGRTREVLTVIYYAAGTRVAEPANEHQRVDMNVFLPGLRPGEDAATDLNPILF